MREFKEFHGKTLDSAIESACDFFNLNRDKLEIEILSGGSTGIFGLMGVKKAKVKARPRPGAPVSPDFDEQEAVAEEQVQEAVSAPYEYEPDQTEPEEEPEQPEYQPEPVQAEQETQPAEQSEPDTVEQAPQYKREAPAVDREQMMQITQEVLDTMLKEILDVTPKLDMVFEAGRLDVFIDDDMHSGLIIGREGATLSSLQYLVNRIVSRRMGEGVRIQLDAGDYREKQNERLRRIALQLADKAKSQNRTQSTRPLSSYHRRVVHLVLQADERVQTRSKGEGPMKRVLIMPKRGRNHNHHSNNHGNRQHQYRQ